MKQVCLVQEITVTPTGGATRVIQEGDVVDFEEVIATRGDEQVPYSLGEALAGRESCFSTFVA